MFRQLCEAVAFAHSHLIVHRDLKPANVRVDNAGKVKLLDVGIARLLDRGASSLHPVDHALTPAYVAPEQFQAAPLSVATDVYALGGILFHLLSGRARIDVQTQSLRSVVQEVCDQDAPSRCSVNTGIRPALLRGDLDAIVQCALQREPQQHSASLQTRRAELLHRRGNLASLAGDAELARRSYREAVSLTHRWASDDQQGLASSLLGEAGALSSLGHLQASAQAYAEALPLLESSLGESVELATELMNSANVLNTLEQVVLARQRIERAQVMLRKPGDVDTGHDGHALLELAKASVTLGEFSRGLEEAEAARHAFSETLGADHPYVWFPSFTAAPAEQGLGRSAAAQQRIAATLQHYREEGDSGMQLRVLQVQTELALDAGEIGPAVESTQQAAPLLHALPENSLSRRWSEALQAATELMQPSPQATPDPHRSALAQRALQRSANALAAALGEHHSRAQRIRRRMALAASPATRST